MANKKSIATGMGIAGLLALGFAAAISTGLMAGQIPTTLYGLSGPAKGCLTNLDGKSVSGHEMSLAQFHSGLNPKVLAGSSGGYCYNPPSNSLSF